MIPIFLVAFVTLVVLLAASDGVARWFFRDPATTIMKCLVFNDPATGVRGVPRSFCQDKAFESPLLDYRFNECGFRTPQPCRPAAPNVFRIVLIGSSFNFGLHVEQQESFAARLGPMLSARLKRPVDVFNEAIYWGFPAAWALRTNSLLLPHPSLILWPLTPADIQNTHLLEQPDKDKKQMGSSRPGAAASFPQMIWLKFIDRLSQTRLILMLQHYLYHSQSEYLSHALTQSDDVDYLRVPEPASLRNNLVIFARNLHQVAAHARAAHVPLVVTMLPTRAQSVMLSNHNWNKDYDPNQLSFLIRRIVEEEGVRYVDMMPGLGAIPGAGQNYLAVDQHPTPDGHRMLATLLANALVQSGTVTAKQVATH